MPVGGTNVALLLTDLEGSTKMWEDDPEAMASAVAKHDELIGSAVRRAGGQLVKSRGEGDSCFCVFTRTDQAAAAAMAIQRGLAARVPARGLRLRARMAIHCGLAELRGGDYYGPVVNRCARLRATAFGEQVLLSAAAADAVQNALPRGAYLIDLGEHRLKDLARPEHVHQLCQPRMPVKFPPIRSLSTLPSNLPIQLTTFVGRDAEIHEVSRLLADRRLVTLVGPAGVGKTRLSLQVAAEILGQFPDGAWVVELGPLGPDLVAREIAAVLRIGIDSKTAPLDGLAEVLRSQRCLLVLDNCEHVLDAAASAADAILRAAPDVRILATSQELLHVPGERAFPVPALAEDEGLALLVERSAGRRFHSSAGETAARQLCSRLDGMPLALELAAARLDLMPVEQLIGRLADRFKVLSDQGLASPRHRTLRAAIDWSHDLLVETEKTLFRRLAVFSGGFRLEAAEDVCAGEGIESSDVLGLLARLVDRSLVFAKETATRQARYLLLETLRDYATDRLETTGEGARYSDQHARFFEQLCAEVAKQLHGHEQAEYCQRLDEDYENVRSALDWNRQRNAEGLAAMCDALNRYWYLRYRNEEARHWMDVCLSLTGVSPLGRARVLYESARFVSVQGNHTLAIERAAEALAILRETNEPVDLARALTALATIHMRNDDPHAALSLCDEAIDIARNAGDRWLQMNILYNTGFVYMSTGRPELAREAFEETLAAARELKDIHQEGVSLDALAEVYIMVGRPEEGRSLAADAIRIFHRLSAPMWLSGAVDTFAVLAIKNSEPLRALRLAGAGLSIRKGSGEPTAQDYQRRMVAYMRPAWDALGDDVGGREFEAGQQLSRDDAVAYALGDRDPFAIASARTKQHSGAKRPNHRERS